MSIWKIAVGVAAMVMLSGMCDVARAAAGTNRKGGGEPGRRSGAVLYVVRADATPAELAALQAALKAGGLGVRKQLRHGAVRAQGPAVPVGSEEALALQLLQSGAVEWAEPDYMVEALGTPNDPLFLQQWWHATVRSPAAWDISTGNTGVIVAVCDTGVQTSHPDLARNLILPGYNTVLNNTSVEDTVGHGTMVAGFVGAIGNNGIGVAGMAWNIRILPVRITYADGVGSAYLSDMAEGLSYAADHGAKVINCSFSGYNSSTIESAAKYARGKGAVVCFAAGNSALNLTVGYPDSTNIVLVGATTAANGLASWSNYGAPIDVVAPGEGVMSTSMGGGYSSGSGTSFASPIAAGLLALVLSVNPGLAPADAERVLRVTCLDLGTAGEDNIYGAGLIRADSAVALATQVIAAPAALKAAISLRNVTLTWTDKANNETGFYVERAVKTRTTTGAFARVATLGANVVTFSEIVAAGSYSYRVQAFNAGTGVVSGYSPVVSVTVK